MTIQQRGCIQRARATPNSQPSTFLLAFGALLVVVLVTLPSCQRSHRTVYAVVPKGQAHIFWQTVRAGATAAARENKVEIDWNGPATESDFARQITIVDDFINRHVDGILLAPTDRDALVPAIRRAKQAGIPLSIFDSGANTEDYVSFVATNNYGGGVMAARRLAEILGKKGRVAMIAVMPGGASTLAREAGFKETLEKEFPDVRLVAWQFGMSDRARSLAVTEDILTAHPNLDGIFASNESSSIGAVQAVKARALAGKLKIVGFDNSPSLVDDMKAGIIDSLILQDPFEIGYQGMKTLLDLKAGRTPPKRIDLPPTLVTKENLSDPHVQRLLNPDLDRYLKEEKRP
ncbi:MAG: substrate-binding domain-containing protein [Terriglobia bacterium]